MRLRKPHLWLVGLAGWMVPSRLREEWQREWEAELGHRETRLAEWNRLDRRARWVLIRRSSGALWDAVCLAPRRLEADLFQDLRFGARMLLHQPGFSLIAILALAI